MSNDNKKAKNPPVLEVSTQRHALIEQQKLIEHKIVELGYPGMTLEAFLAIKPDIDKNQEQAARLLELQQDILVLLQQNNDLAEVIYIEPSKLHETIEAVEKLLIRQTKQKIYQRAGKLVRITQVPSLPQEKIPLIKRPSDAVVIKEIDQVYLTVFLTEVGRFVRFDARSETFNNIDCPERIARCLLAQQEWELPILKGITNIPTLRSDGSILDNAGYDVASGMLFIPNNCSFEKVPEIPTKTDIEAAKHTLLCVLKDFPFENEVARSVALSAILTALIRKSIATSPLFGFSAPKMGSGKSLLADVVAMISTGRPNSVIAQAENEAEEKKRLMAILTEGDSIVCYDNIERPFGSAALCAVLTQSEYKDRMLGGNETRTVLTNVTFLATGNNLTFAGDISTRTLLCKLDPAVERPEERSFEINLHTYIPKNRAHLVRAGLIILRAYHVAGRPAQDIKPFGRFEEWSNWIRSAIVWIGMADPCESRKEIENEDPVRILLISLFSSWYELFGDRAVKAREVVARATQTASDYTQRDAQDRLKDAVLELASASKGNINLRVFAKKLSTFKGRIEDCLRLEDMGTNQGTTQWRIRKVST